MRAIVVALSVGLGASCIPEPENEAPWPALEPVVRPEHPRPDFRRDSFVNLNTEWEFAFDPDDRGLSEGWFNRDDVWHHRIQVPYAWESPLSGLVPPHDGPYSPLDTLAATTYRGVAWYRLRLPDPLPVTAGFDWHLVFGSVDFAASVWLNGQHALDHQGGYSPFSVNVDQAAGKAARLSIVVRVEDYTELNQRAQPVGKQGGGWYTRTSGIWQTVYLEQRPALYLDSMRLVADPDAGKLWVVPELSREAPATLRLEARLDGQLAGSTETALSGSGEPVELPLDPVVRWDVDTPVLYDLDLMLEGPDGTTDVVHSYFGLVRVSTDWLPGHSPTETSVAAEQYQSFWVNGQPRYLRCVLDQSYYPDGVYTAPSVEAIRADLELARSFGFNCIRLHIKVDEPVKYRLADELGLYVVYDLPSLDMQANNAAGFAGRAHVETTLRRAIARDANHPSIVAWVLFNENWGLMEQGSLLHPPPLQDSPELQQWVRDLVAVARTLDPTRPVEDNSAGGLVERFEHVDTDVNSFHHYGSDAAEWRALLADQAAQTFPGSSANFVGGAVQDGDPWLNSEFASFSTLGTPTTQIYCDLFSLLNELRRSPKLTGYVLTQLTDVEYEHNGLLAYDRSAKPDLCTRHGVELRNLLGDDFIGFEWLPGTSVPAGATVDVPLWVAHWSSPQSENLRVLLRWGDSDAVTLDVATAAYEVTATQVSIPTPNEPGPATLVAELRDSTGTLRSANRLELELE